MVDKISLPVIIPDRLLISPGIWNGNEYSAQELMDAFARTNWEDKQKISLWLNHDDGNTAAFVGYVKNQTLASGGRVFGDLEIWDEKLAVNLTQAMAKFGVSAKIKGDEDKKGKMHNFSFENFSVVTVPACSDAYINLSKEEDKIIISKYLISDEIEKLKEITGMETERKKQGMSPGEFYAVPRDPLSDSSLPIFDKVHTQNAMARFNQTKFKDASEKASAKRKIMVAAGKFGIKISDKFKSLLDIDERRLEIDKNMAEEEEKKEEVVEEKAEAEEEKKELSERDLLKSLCDKFDKLVSLLSKNLALHPGDTGHEEEDEDEKKKKKMPKEMEEEEKAEEKAEEKPKEKAEESGEVEKENKDLIAVKKELRAIKEKLNAPKSKTVRNLSSNTVGEDAKYDINEFCNLLGSVDRPMKFN